ncbi:hypothetical protein [uncultured Litoreibacter sp.]|uniref:hypothetical protein n=1 Tax=uncultured Litoreibacter sp. TaxID=1392394 RepID=UPI002619C460|nr:hypothetical protein [uncultured Litoreibacter sp.]
MNISFILKPREPEFEPGIEAFLSLMTALGKLRLFQSDWKAYDRPIFDGVEAYVARTRDGNFEPDPSELKPAEQEFFHASSYIEEPGQTDILAALTYWWGAQAMPLNRLNIEIRRPHSTLGTDISLYRDTIAAVIAWQRPQHVSMAWPVYRMEHHALDKARQGLGWLGWVPFELSSTQVPEAAIVEPMADGTFLASQPDFWFAGGPNKDDDAIAGAQALELRLNALGVLPTSVELTRGDWGQGG